MWQHTQPRSTNSLILVGNFKVRNLVFVFICLLIVQSLFNYYFNILFRWFGGGVIPDLFPNSEVKPASADDTLRGKVGGRRNKVLKELCH